MSRTGAAARHPSSGALSDREPVQVQLNRAQPGAGDLALSSSEAVPLSLLGVFGHPDDEALHAGGRLAQHAAQGARTAVVTATWAPGTHRAAELGDALRILGAGAPRLLGYADLWIPESAPGRPRLCDAPLEEAVGQVVAHLRDFRPDIVVTHDALGNLSGHRDHRRTHQVTMLAVLASGLEYLYPEAGAPWRPRFVEFATHPRSAVGDLGPLLSGVKSVLSVPDEQVTSTLDVTPWVEHKWRAILAHRSQLGRDRPLPSLLSRLDEEARNRILAIEHYIRISLP